MKKRTLTAMTVALLAAGSLTSLNVFAAGSLLVWEDIQKSVGNDEAKQAFEKKYDVTINVQELPYGGQVESLRMDGPAGTGPDIINLPHDQIGSAVVQGLLTPLQVDKSVLDTFTPSAIQALTYEGQLYGIPKAVETVVMVYNKDLLPELPKTMDELFDVSKQFRAKGDYGLLAKWDEIYYSYGIIKAMGGDIFGKKADGSDDPNKLLLNNDGAVKGAEYVQKFFTEGLFPSGIVGDSGLNAIDSLFTSQRAAVVQTGPWSFQPYKDAGINYGVAPLPVLPNGKHMGSFMGVKSYSISTYSKNKDLALKYIEFINNYDNAKRRFELTGEVPAVKALIDDPIIKDNEGARAVAMQAQYATPMPSIPEMNEVWGPANSALQLIATGKQAPKDALDNAVDSIQMQIEANHAMMGL
ncbi:arabinogalactan oligomer / maltooligosaccharide transport system substrate-binding protein [Vibrio xiamenensis]|uniref:Maltodextrin-binding protein n=1 Tax=Vibrio xiamenensis TaxID=861298 RepID=A0A1G7XL77_9VIBR|nr:extracellular solute-binding protein [Vibrio xiamenensis]SDG84959.1 arabinogalactan oligomer / maltooligosaccharide transport system substrate-binding protein [Vibrio xiamenensis]